MSSRDFNPLDRAIMNLDYALRTVFGRPQGSGREYPAAPETEPEMTSEERAFAARLMRINHAGEIAAQGLYQGQALTAKLPAVRDKMERAAQEENDHLLWCESRIKELGGHASLLNPLWYAGSLAIGATAGLAGDKWSLGFVAETERQVERHLDGHLEQLPPGDAKSRAVLQQMREDEIRHGATARAAGGAPLPAPVRRVMGVMSKVMTRTAFWV